MSFQVSTEVRSVRLGVAHSCTWWTRFGVLRGCEAVDFHVGCCTVDEGARFMIFYFGAARIPNSILQIIKYRRPCVLRTLVAKNGACYRC